MKELPENENKKKQAKEGVGLLRKYNTKKIRDRQLSRDMLY